MNKFLLTILSNYYLQSANYKLSNIIPSDIIYSSLNYNNTLPWLDILNIFKEVGRNILCVGYLSFSICSIMLNNSNYINLSGTMLMV